ncbi:MAG: hypothetical protein Q7J73_05855 [Dehalococcoidales bacterium]|nr:hypothetical protein [Dehalococcoidales bacterium]
MRTGVDKMLPPGISRIVMPLISAIMVLVLVGPLPVQAAPPPPIDLILGGTGATTLNFTNIKPGDNGNMTITLHNAGTLDGQVTVWVSNLVNIRGPVPDPKFASLPGELADYLLLNASSRGLAANIALPAKIINFPQTVSGPYYVRINPLRAGETINITWKWELPYQTGNNVQGRGASFKINYMLEELPPPEEEEVIISPPVTPPVTPPAPTPQPPAPTPPVTPPVTPPAPTPQPPAPTPPVTPPVTTGVVLEGITGTVMIDADGLVQETAVLKDKTGNFVLNIDKGTRITGPDGEVLDRLELIVTGERVNVLENMVVLSPAYKLTAYRKGVALSRINFNPYVTIAISYDTQSLPENALTPFMVNFTQNSSLVRLDSPPGSTFESGKIPALVTHASFFAVVAELVPSPPPLPPHFRASNLIISPEQTRPGLTVSISLDITNDGAVGGSYELYLVIDGVVRAIKQMTIEPNSVSTVMFEVSDLAVGTHQVKVAGLTGEFRIIAATVVTPPGTPIDWSLLDLSVAAMIAAAVLATYLVIRKLRQAEHSTI